MSDERLKFYGKPIPASDVLIPTQVWLHLGKSMRDEGSEIMLTFGELIPFSNPESDAKIDSLHFCIPLNLAEAIVMGLNEAIEKIKKENNDD